MFAKVLNLQMTLFPAWKMSLTISIRLDEEKCDIGMC